MQTFFVCLAIIEMSSALASLKRLEILIQKTAPDQSISHPNIRELCSNSLATSSRVISLSHLDASWNNLEEFPSKKHFKVLCKLFSCHFKLSKVRQNVIYLFCLFQRRQSNFSLSNLSLNLEKGQLMMVVGPVGSGKV